jgi:phosphatidylglycerophosphate synthase
MAKATLSSIVRFKPNLITFLRFIMILASAQFYQAEFVLTSAGITMISVILDYVDGMVARKYSQCTFFGEGLDWITDLTTTIVVCQWLTSL